MREYKGLGYLEFGAIMRVAPGLNPEHDVRWRHYTGEKHQAGKLDSDSTTVCFELRVLIKLQGVHEADIDHHKIN